MILKTRSISLQYRLIHLNQQELGLRIVREHSYGICGEPFNFLVVASIISLRVGFDVLAAWRYNFRSSSKLSRRYKAKMLLSTAWMIA